MDVPVSIRSEDGYFGLECPTCRTYFRASFHAQPAKVICAGCGVSGSIESMLPKKSKEAIVAEMGRTLQKSLRGLKGFNPARLPAGRAVEPVPRSTLWCSTCDLKVQVNRDSGHCPTCGKICSAPTAADNLP